MYSIKDIATYTNLSNQTIRNHIKKHNIEYTTKENKWLLEETQVIKLFEILESDEMPREFLKAFFDLQTFANNLQNAKEPIKNSEESASAQETEIKYLKMLNENLQERIKAQEIVINSLQEQNSMLAETVNIHIKESAFITKKDAESLEDKETIETNHKRKWGIFKRK